MCWDWTIWFAFGLHEPTLLTSGSSISAFEALVGLFTSLDHGLWKNLSCSIVTTIREMSLIRFWKSSLKFQTCEWYCKIKYTIKNKHTQIHCLYIFGVQCLQIFDQWIRSGIWIPLERLGIGSSRWRPEQRRSRLSKGSKMQKLCDGRVEKTTEKMIE